jgi:hypothetical protein
MQDRYPHFSWSVTGVGILFALSFPTVANTAVVTTNLSISPTEIARLDLTPPSQSNSPTNSRPLLKIGGLKNYQHPSNLFSIDVPQKWQFENLSTPQHVRVQWQDVNKEGLICVEIFNFSRQLNEEELGAELSRIIGRVYKSYPQLNISLPVTQPTGAVRVTWSYRDKSSNGSMVTYTGNSFMRQVNGKVSATYYVLPSPQYAQLKNPLNQIIRSYQITEGVAVP